MEEVQKIINESNRAVTVELMNGIGNILGILLLWWLLSAPVAAALVFIIWIFRRWT